MGYSMDWRIGIMTNGKKTKLLTIILLLFCLFLSSCSQEYSSTKEEDYERYIGEVLDAELYMPKLDDLGDYESIFAARRTINDPFIDTTDSVTLIVQYHKDVFDFVVNQIETKYDFINFALDNYKDYEAEVNNYHFRVDSTSLDEMICYPSGEIVFEPFHSLLIGVNMSDNKIAYLYYHDIEIHEMNDLDTFIEKKFVLE